MWRLILLFLISLALIALNYQKEKRFQKSFFAFVTLIYIFAIGYSGAILTRAVAPLFFAHILTLIVGYVGFILYLWRDRVLWYFLFLPILPIAIYILLNYLDGSRYETLNNSSLYFT